MYLLFIALYWLFWGRIEPYKLVSWSNCFGSVIFLYGLRESPALDCYDFFLKLTNIFVEVKSFIILLKLVFVPAIGRMSEISYELFGKSEMVSYHWIAWLNDSV